MKNVFETIQTLEEIGKSLQSLENLGVILIKTPVEVLARALELRQKGWRLDYQSWLYDGDDYDSSGGREEWALSGPGIAKPKYYHGEWDYREHTDNLHPCEVLEIMGVKVARKRRRRARQIVEVLQALTAIYPKKEGGDS